MIREGAPAFFGAVLFSPITLLAMSFASEGRPSLWVSVCAVAALAGVVAHPFLQRVLATPVLLAGLALWLLCSLLVVASFV